MKYHKEGIEDVDGKDMKQNLEIDFGSNFSIFRLIINKNRTNINLGVQDNLTRKFTFLKKGTGDVWNNKPSFTMSPKG